MNLLYASGKAAPAETGFLVSSGGSVLASELDVIAAGQQVFHVGQSGSVGASGNANFGGGVFLVGDLGISAAPGVNSFFYVSSGNINFKTGGGGLFAIDNSGNVVVSGNLSVGGTKNFQIDDPLDPANRYLYHSAVESSEMMNIYTGNAITNQRGDATVVLPAWFQALNGDFRYQLTVLGQFAQAIVASEIQDRKFSIKTDKPNVKVSWQITGVRQDAYAKAHPLLVEEDKPAVERGYYIHPELFSQPQSKGISYARRLPVRDEQPESAKAERTRN
jgi:hypothetical protein